MLYSRELMVTTNVNTKAKRFYMKICGVWSRISEADYCNYVETAINSNCYLTRNTKKFTRQAAIYYYDK
ncbi:Phage protein [Escherichia phage VpaE1_ev108]|uniref:Phage protein n=1 Tax=Escherichia phage VpaE1_ev108 TaxID=2695837 RepID=A0A653FYQ5_9CAUD|nr:Phage protein [Escherichia phage VpaE1_ev108]